VEAGRAIARKHVDVAVRLKRIATDCCPDNCVYLATHTQQAYQDVEKQCGAEFWSIRAYSEPDPTRGCYVKAVDAIITLGDRVRFVIEIKWGAVPGKARTDMLLTQADWLNVAARLRSIVVCRVHGPVVKPGVRYQSPVFAESCDYAVADHARRLLVADFSSMRRVLPEQYEEACRVWALAGCDPPLADINERVGEIPSLRAALTD